MPRLPFMKFFPADWTHDTQILPLDAQGAWMKLICAMWTAPERGRLDWTEEQFAKFLGLNERDACVMWNTLEISGVGEFLPAGDGKVTIMSRRMLREEAQRLQTVERQRRRRSRLRHGEVTPMSRGYSRCYILEANKSSTPPDSDRPSKNGELDPRIRSAAEPIYNSDPAKFSRLPAWIRAAEKHPYPTEVIVTALEKFNGYAKHVDSWWAYLNTVITKVYQDQCFSEHQREHNAVKAEANKPL